MPTLQKRHSQALMQRLWQMHFARHYENQTLLAVQSKRAIVQKLRKSRKKICYSVVNLPKKDEISGVSALHGTYGWRRSLMQKIRSRMHLVDPIPLAGRPFLFSFRV